MRVLSVPAEHPYTRAIRPPHVFYLPDPDADGDGHWWPHPALEAQFWRASGRPDVDAVHIHFGFEHRTPAEIAELTHALPVPLVITVHDIDNPHLATAAEQAEHHERLRLLVDAAAAVITLTDCAAERLRTDFGATDVNVIPHPPIVDTPPAGPLHGGGAGVFLKSLRANVVADPAFYRAIAARVPLTVFVHDEPATRELRDALSGAPGITLVAHDRLDDPALHAAVAGLDVCLLPYTSGTHSGWLEMCRNLGTDVAVPDIGCYAGQADTPEAVETYAVGDAEAAARAVDKLRARGAVPYAGGRRNAHEADTAHARIYSEVVR